MKKILAGLAVAGLLASAAHGQLTTHNIHTWVKASEMEGSNGQVICVCECGIGGETRTTSGYGFCSC